MKGKINYHEKVPCFGNEPAADIELLRRTAEADRKREAFIANLEEHYRRAETMLFAVYIAVICASLPLIGYSIYLIIQQITK